MSLTHDNPNHDHAVTAMGTNTYGYDANGNQSSRNIGGSAYSLTYDAENRLTGVSGAATATFVYDGDGNRVKGTIGGVTSTYIGNYFEWTGSTSTMKRYYYAGATRVAIRTGSSTLNYLLGDHLGSTSITTNSSGEPPSQPPPNAKTAFRGGVERYMPWGESRYTYGTTPTTYQFTGQRLESGLGLYFYNARFYDPAAGRFISADTVVTGAGNTQAYDRYAYTLNNPIKYIDPSGHLSCKAKHVAEGDCSDFTITQILQEFYGVTLTGDGWTREDISAVYLGVYATGNKFANEIQGGITGSEAYKSVFVQMEFNMWDGQCSEGCWGWSLGAHNIRLYRHYTYTDKNNVGYILNTKITQQLVVHELAHSFERAITSPGGKSPRDNLSTDMTSNRYGLAGSLWTWQQSEDVTPGEIFADMFLGWVYDIWYTGNDPVSRNLAIDRQNFMNQYMPIWLQNIFP